MEKIFHVGEKPPVLPAGYDLIQVRYRDGRVLTSAPNFFYWGYPPAVGSRIISYRFVKSAGKNREDMAAVLTRLARLNENAGEIGDGMLRSLVAEARTVLKEGGFEV